MNDKNAPQSVSHYGKVDSLAFYVLSSDEIASNSNVIINNKEIMKYDMPAPDGLYDPRMGTTDFAWNCHTCGNRKTICPGHFGSVELRYPLKSPMFRDELLKWLKVICHECGELVVETKKYFPAVKRLGEFTKLAKQVKKCPKCDAPHNHVIKDPKRPFIFLRQLQLEEATRDEELYNHHIKTILEKIRDDTVLLLGKPLRSHPRNFIMTTIAAPPNTIRPDIKRIGGTRSSNSDTTSLLKTIVEINENLPEIVPPDDQITPALRDAYSNLEMAYYSMIRGGGGGDIKLITNTHKPPVALAERLPKKHGRFRRNLMGKRVEYMIRSVITGDSRLKINEVGVPLLHARNLEVPEVVTEANRSRLMQYFINGDKHYPGCKHIIKASDKGTYRIDIVGKEYNLQSGDIVMRDLITGDYICFNRQPSLLFSNIAGMRVVVMEVGETLRINPAVCNFFNADFDGDQMNSIVPQNIQSRNECMTISKASRWFISPQKHAPAIGAFFDGLIGISELTKSGLKFDKWHAMQLFADIGDITGQATAITASAASNAHRIDYTFRESTYSNRQLVSRLIPKINLSGKEPSMYKENYAKYINYNPDDIKISIERGELKSGVLDKATTGQDVAGSIFHIIANTYGNDVALKCIYDFQQIVHRFFLYHGFTTGIADINISPATMEEISRRTEAMILNARKITQRLNSGKLIAPIGTKLRDFYENEQLMALSPGDDFVNVILSDTKIESNGLVNMVMSGSKGKMSNVFSISAAIGNQTINGRRFLYQAGWGRTSPYFLRYDTEPIANGFISTSFRDGVSSISYAFMAAEARHGLISNALSTSVTGYQNRISIKNLESIIIDNLRKATKGMNVIQPIYAELGVDPSKLEKVKFPTVMISNKEFEDTYKTPIKNVAAHYRSKEVEKLLDEEFAQLKADREYYRYVHTTLENHNPKEYVFSNQKQMPVNVYRIVEDVVYNYKEITDNVPAAKRGLDPEYAIRIVRELCDNLGYVFLNELQKKQQRVLPSYLVSATKLLQVLIRSYLCTSYLIKKGVINELLDIIIQNILLVYKKSLVDPGYDVGILAAECISEPMTQYVLDSKHRTGGQGGTKTNAIIRIQEILGAKDTETMKNPHMTIMVKPEYESDKLKVQEIANHIEMMNFGRFVSDIRVFYEEYKKPVHPAFKHEKADIEDFERANYGVPVPTDLANWCIRFGLNREEIILKSMKLETMIMAIRREFPELFVMYTAENAEKVFIRCYIRNSMIKKYNDYLKDVVMYYMKEVQNVIVRGVKNILSTHVLDITKNVMAEDGSYGLKKIYGIYANGSNLTDILSNPYIDPHRTQSDSIEEVERVFGIIAARNKIINEMLIALDGLNRFHCTIFGDEMCYSGQVTNIQKTGLEKRESSNVTLRVSFQTAIQVIQQAAINGLVDKISGISGPLVLGTNPNVGTTYNKVVVNQSFIEENSKRLAAAIEDL